MLECGTKKNGRVVNKQLHCSAASTSQRTRESENNKKTLADRGRGRRQRRTTRLFAACFSARTTNVALARKKTRARSAAVFGDAPREDAATKLVLSCARKTRRSLFAADNEADERAHFFSKVARPFPTDRSFFDNFSLPIFCFYDHKFAFVFF